MLEMIPFFEETLVKETLAVNFNGHGFASIFWLVERCKMNATRRINVAFINLLMKFIGGIFSSLEKLYIPLNVC
jgi:hypothetical protein